ncbi:multiple antibiotic resistance protein [Acidiphilium sp. MT5]
MTLLAMGSLRIGADALLLGFPALFSIVNPLGGAIIFNEATADRTHDERLILARRVALNATLVMLVSLWAGTYILSFFGITLNALRLAGGLVVATRAYQMLTAPEVQDARKQAQAETASPTLNLPNIATIAFFPLTLPLTTGPGTIAVAIALGTQRPVYGTSLLWFFAGLSLAALATAALIWITYSLSDRLGSLLGETGRHIVARLAAFLLLGIGVQIMLSGAVPVLHQALGVAGQG